jgi:hypothetical protein
MSEILASLTGIRAGLVTIRAEIPRDALIKVFRSG